jgi:hypothetical protein
MNPAHWIALFFTANLLTVHGAGMSSTEKPTEQPPTQTIIVAGKPVEIPGPHPNCNVIDLQKLAFTTHDALKRKQSALKWLRNHGPDCRDYDLNTIYNSSATWLGTADGVEIKALIYTLYYHTRRPTDPGTPVETLAIPQLPLKYPEDR